MNQSGNLSVSNSCNYELANSADIALKMSAFFMQPSPLGGDVPSPFDLSNIMKKNKITGSTMFDEK